MPAVYIICMLVACKYAAGQDILLGARDRLSCSSFGCGWLRAAQFGSSEREPRENGLPSGINIAEDNGRHRRAHHAEGRAARAARRSFAAHPTCNFTSCCYRATTITLAKGSSLQAASALACGGVAADGSTAPCHTPVAAHTPLLLALRTRVQLSLHALTTQLDRLVVSRPRAWLEQQLAELQQLLRPTGGSARLALSPAQSAGELAGGDTAGSREQPPQRLRRPRRQNGKAAADQGNTDANEMVELASGDALDGLAAELALLGASPEALARLRRLVQAHNDDADHIQAGAAGEVAALGMPMVPGSTGATVDSMLTGTFEPAIHPAERNKQQQARQQHESGPDTLHYVSAHAAGVGCCQAASTAARAMQGDVAAKSEREPAAWEARGGGARPITAPLVAHMGPPAAARTADVSAAVNTCICAAEIFNSTQHPSAAPRWEIASDLLVKLLAGVAAGALGFAALAVRQLSAAAIARRRDAAEAAVRLEGVIEGNRRQAEALAAEYEAQLATLQAQHLADAERARVELSAAQLQVQQLRASRDGCVRLAVMSQRTCALAVVQLATAVPALQRRQTALSEALISSVAGWQRRGAAAAASLAHCRVEVMQLRQQVVEQKKAAERKARDAIDAAAAAMHSTTAAHNAQVASLTQRFQEELEEERRGRTADQRAAQVAASASADKFSALRRRHGANVRSWLALRSWVALKMTDVAERAGRLAAEHRAQAATAQAMVQDLQGQLAAARTQLAAQVGAAVASRGAVSELTELLAGKDADILELEGRLGGAEAALESQRLQAGALMSALTATEESLVAARAESTQLTTALEKAQTATAAAEARAAELLSANQVLDVQVKQFTDIAADLARIQETYVAPHQARVAALEAQLEQERAEAAAAAAKSGAEMAMAAVDLAEARRESESLRRARAELADRLERRERELKALQAELAELSRREEEGLENALCVARQRDRDHEASLQQLLLPLPADVKAAMLVHAASAGCATSSPLSSGGVGGGGPAMVASAGIVTPVISGSGMGTGGACSVSGVRGALGLGSVSITRK